MSTENDAWQTRSYNAAADFAAAVKALHETNPWPEHVLLDQAINTLMTELWDRGFSPTEIRSAFESATLDMPRYAAGQERRS